MLTDIEIENGMATARYGVLPPHHEHYDCIRFAYEWLDAQKKTSGLLQHPYPLKHIIEKWAGRYVSETDVTVAAHMHPEIKGKYPYFNISKQLIRPNERRLVGLSQAMTQPTYREWESDRFRHDIYKGRQEV